MERIFFVENGDLDVVNNHLEKGAKVKSITAIPEPISSYSGYAGGRSEDSGYDGYNSGQIYAYIVLEYNE